MARVLLVHQPTGGGVGRHVADLAEGLRGRGHDVILCSPRPPTGAAERGDARHLELGRAVSPRADGRAVVALARIVRELRPEIVHAHSSKAGAVARLARTLHPATPLLYTPHGYAFSGYFERSRERRAYRMIERAIAPFASRVLCVCEAEARLARSIGPASRVRVVHNGIEPAGDVAPDARVAALAAEGPLLGALTQLRPGKGLETLIDATPALLAQHGGARIAIVGEGPNLEALRCLLYTSPSPRD